MMKGEFIGEKLGAKGDDERASQGSKAASFGIYCMQTRTITHKTWQTKKNKQNTQGKGLI